MMSISGGAINSSIENFYQAINGIADNPSDSGIRDIALSSAQVLSTNFQAINEDFEQIEKSTNGEIEKIAEKISSISSDLAKINEQVMFGAGSTQSGQQNDLLDSRDKLITELGQYTSVNAIVDANGIMNVMIGQGTTLVSGNTAMTLQVEAGDADPLQTQLKLVGPNSSVSVIGENIGGELGAKFTFRDQDLAQVRSEMNRLAMAISDTLNSSQAQGLDLNQQQGANLFTDINTLAIQQSRVLASSKNTGSTDARINITDVSLVPTDEFEIRYDGANYDLINKSTGSSTTLVQSPPGTYATNLGFEFVIDSGISNAGDVFTIRPTENSAALMKTTLNDGAAFAASSAIDITPSDNNVSAGEVNIVDVYDPVAARAAMPMRIDILESPAGVFNYTYTDSLGVTSPPVAYTPPAQTIDLPPLPSTAAFSVEITGTPSGVATNAPEQFHIGDAFGTGNSTNAVAMAKTQEQGVLNGGKESFDQSLSITTATIGSKANSAELVADTASALYTQAYNRNQSVSGVNIDEEAANLMRFQQAYQASSQIISVANTLFDTLLSSTR